MLDRALYTAIWSELSAEKSMVFLAGPRQGGKTTLARSLSESYANKLYFNWDIATDKRRLIENPHFFEDVVRRDSSRPLVILDEIHKYKHWKNYLKGVYDRFHTEFQFLVSGSGRLDLFMKGGDSLAGRYSLMHLWPLTLAELHNAGVSFEVFSRNPIQPHADQAAAIQSTWERLAHTSGFPEPYLSGKKASYRRWAAAYHRQLVREDIRDMTDVKHVDDMEILFSLLPSRVGAPLSIPSLATDLKTAYNTIKSWLGIFERFYLTFSLSPWTPQIARSIHKERKTYLFDYAGIEDLAAKFENMVALELFRAVSNWNDMGWGNFSLHYIRTKEGREVDFLVSQNRKPMFLIETKTADDTPSPNLIGFQKALGVPAAQLLDRGDAFKKASPAGYPLLTAPAVFWLPRLP